MPEQNILSYFIFFTLLVIKTHHKTLSNQKGITDA